MTNFSANSFHARGSSFKLSCDHWSLRFLPHFEHNSFQVGNLARSWSISTWISHSCRKVANLCTLTPLNLLNLMDQWIRLLYFIQDILRSRPPVITWNVLTDMKEIILISEFSFLKCIKKVLFHYYGCASNEICQLMMWSVQSVAQNLQKNVS